MKIHYFDTVTSTNTVLREMACEGAPEGTIVIAHEQTAGRGRMGKQFFSPSHTGLYMSILVRPDISAQDSLLLTTSTAVAVARAIESVSDNKADIKWVNDIYIADKKVCGILVESSYNSTTSKLDFAIIGIGINLICPPEGFPDEISNIATSIYTNSTFSENNKEELISNIIKYFFEYYHNITDKKFIEEYIRRSMIIGRKITIIDSSHTTDATALEIDDQCRLKVRLNDNTETWLSYGDVSIKPC